MSDVKEFAELRNILEDAMTLHRKPEKLLKLEEFLRENTVTPPSIGQFSRDPEELKRLQAENLAIDYAISYVDNHACSGIREIAEPIRATIWKAAGILCDDFSKLHIGGDVRFFSPQNITLVTGGYDFYFAGGRSTTFLDGRGKLVVFGPIDVAGGAKLFTHDHFFNDPDEPHYLQGRSVLSYIVYPDCMLGEDTHIFGSLQLKTILADISMVGKKSLPPYTVIGGIGKSFEVLRYLDFPKKFPPKFLQTMLDRTKQSFPALGAHLEKYYRAIGELSRTPGDRAEAWENIREEVRKSEDDYFKKEAQ